MIAGKIAIIVAIALGIAMVLYAQRSIKDRKRACVIDPMSEQLNIIGDGACDWSAPPLRRSARVRDIEPRGM